MAITRQDLSQDTTYHKTRLVLSQDKPRQDKTIIRQDNTRQTRQNKTITRHDKTKDKGQDETRYKTTQHETSTRPDKI